MTLLMKKVCIMQVLLDYQENSTSGYDFSVMPVSKDH